MNRVIVDVINFFLIILPVLLSVAYLTLFERKILAAAGRRLGPNVVGLFGLLQPLADGLKLLLRNLSFLLRVIKVYTFLPLLLLLV